MPQTYITYHSMASRGWNDRNTQTAKDIHIKQELNKKSNNILLLLSSRGDGGDCQTIDAQLVRACATPSENTVC